ncbi:MAG: hypothetical protein ACQEQC_07975 [Elusimicrobiota bacterium]
MNKLQKISFIIMVSLLLGGCVDSEKPVISLLEAEPAGELLGFWKANWGRKQDIYFQIGEAGGEFPENTLRVEMITRKDDGTLDLQSEVMVFAAGTVGNLSLLNGTPVGRDLFKDIFENGWQPDTSNNYMIFKYAVDEDEVSLYFMENKLKRELIKSGKIEGEIVDGNSKITVSSEKLKEFLKTGDGRDVFSEEPLKMTRLD